MTTRNSTSAQLNGERLKKICSILTIAMNVVSVTLIAIFYLINKN